MMPPLGACAVKRKEEIKAMSDDKPITIHCANCDGQNIKADAYADWNDELQQCCLLYTSPSPRDRTRSRMPSSA